METVYPMLESMKFLFFLIFVKLNNAVWAYYLYKTPSLLQPKKYFIHNEKKG